MQLSSAPNGKNHPKIMIFFCAKMRLNISSYPDFLREVSLVILLLITVISSFFCATRADRHCQENVFQFN